MIDNKIYSRDSEETPREYVNSDSQNSEQSLKTPLKAEDHIGRYVKLSWENINYYASTKGKTIQILKSVSGHANPGEFLAIMGSSGSGKTSLLNILANRVTSAGQTERTGTITANGKDTKEISISKYAAYVTQDDILLPVLTPRDCLMFYAALRCPGNAKERLAKVEEILSDLNIAKIADNLIGNALALINYSVGHASINADRFSTSSAHSPALVATSNKDLLLLSGIRKVNIKNVYSGWLRNLNSFSFWGQIRNSKPKTKCWYHNRKLSNWSSEMS
ncbi:unnamed protein product [Blepharisma stoltei]|uniref:ABC transporter domain-containing protein n=1 Tax=Blepharisma stoltei TaxID=1481888 RepID=A0AAU9IB53_9CILI|nr:unnamed protein product [Blepharisma stoltei]